MSTIFYDTTFDALIDTLANYYGTSSIGWQEVTDAGFSNEAIIDSINNIPGYHAIQNSDGTVRMYVQSRTYGTMSNSTAAISGGNSNVQTGTNSSGNTSTITAPASTQYNSQNKFEANKGLNATTPSQFIVRSVVPAIAAAGVGIQLGKTIDKTLYNLNPDFWDAHGLSTLDPDTWSSITSDMSGSAGQVALATAFNLLFGINPNTGRVQPYIDEKQFAYLAAYMQQQGVFNTGGIYPQKDGIILSSGFVRSGPQLTRVPVTNIYSNQGYFATDNDARYTFVDDGEHIGMVVASETRRHGAYVYTHEQGSGQYFSLTASRIVNYNNKTYYCGLGGYDNGNHQPMWVPTPGTISPYPTIIAPSSGLTVDEAIAYLLLYGDASPSIEGFGNQPGATFPQLNNDMSVDDVLQALKTQFPDIWNNSEENTVVQPDGSTKIYTYVPIGIPNAENATDTQPTADGENSSQEKPYFEYDSSTGQYDPQAFDEFEGFIDPFDPTPPDDSSDDTEDDTGEGDTPTPTPPVGSASALWRIYNPSQSQLDSFGSWLWSSDFVDQLLKVFSDPMQAIIGLHKVFVNPPISGSGPIKVGYLTSNASANYVSGQYVTVDCGSVTLYEKYGNVYDYDPFVKLRLFLPFIGIVDLSTADAMRGTINVKYHVDVLTGSCLAEVSITRDGAGGVLYTYSGNCAVQYPVSSGSYVGIITGLLGIGAGLVAGGFSAPALLTGAASVGRMHTDVQHSGNIGSNSGAMGGKKPYIIIERTQNKMPKRFKEVDFIDGYDYCTLSEIHGFVRVKEIKLNATCTLEEKEEIYELLKIGIYT